MYKCKIIIDDHINCVISKGRECGMWCSWDHGMGIYGVKHLFDKKWIKMSVIKAARIMRFDNGQRTIRHVGSFSRRKNMY